MKGWRDVLENVCDVAASKRYLHMHLSFLCLQKSAVHVLPANDQFQRDCFCNLAFLKIERCLGNQPQLHPATIQGT